MPELTDNVPIHQDIFFSGKDKPEGYRQLRAPAIAWHCGKVFVFTEGRLEDRKDPGRHSQGIDIVYKTSNDTGATWSELQVLARGSAGYPGSTSKVAYQPTVVVDAQDGSERLYLFYNRAQLRTFYRVFDFYQQSWSEEFDLTLNMQNRPEGIRKLNVNIASGVQLPDGMLVIPMTTALTSDPIERNRPSNVYSDDNGKSWKYGGHGLTGANENQLSVKVGADGRIWLVISSRRDGLRKAGILPRRLNFALFDNSTGLWNWRPNTTPLDAEGEKIWSYPVSAGFECLTVKGVNGETEDYYLLVLPQGKTESGVMKPEKLCVLMSKNSVDYTNSKLLHPGPAGYSDIATNDDLFLTVWERRGKNDEGELQEIITLTTANLRFLEDEQSPDC